MKCVSYSLFGYGQPRVNGCFDFNSYLRNLLTSIRLNRLILPDWVVVVQTDQTTYDAYKGLFDALPITININEPAPLTKAMLWRMRPVYDYNTYTHVICRDLDSPITYREAQCIQEWINSDLAAHAITDSISHGVPMLGGMIGFVTGYWPMRTHLQHWADMFKTTTLDFNRKGADQDYLNAEIYPKFADASAPAIMQHYLLGMPNTFLPGYRNAVPNIEVPGVSADLAESNEICSHMGQAGWLLPQAFRLFRKHADRFTDLLEIEKQWPSVAYWVNDGTFE